MSFISDYIDQNPQETQRLFGIDCNSLQELIGQVESIHRQQQSEIEQSKIRIIDPGGGNKPKL
ncbi:MAG: IS5/IS1182 family transposase, partial [Pseudanabaenales cyanobacterium]|nr:IS5/IS1182 family transposase [Pseudanabaenales cyanobacterium]